MSVRRSRMPAGATGAGGALAYIVAEDQRPNTTHGDGATGGSWNNCKLNTLVTDTASIVISLSGDVLTVPAGTYEFELMKVLVNTGQSKAQLYNDTDAAEIKPGFSLFTGSGGADGVGMALFVGGVFTLSSSKGLRIRAFPGVSVATYGFGYATSSGSLEIYGQLQLWKRA